MMQEELSEQTLSTAYSQGGQVSEPHNMSNFWNESQNANTNDNTWAPMNNSQDTILMEIEDYQGHVQFNNQETEQNHYYNYDNGESMTLEKMEIVTQNNPINYSYNIQDGVNIVSNNQNWNNNFINKQADEAEANDDDEDGEYVPANQSSSEDQYEEKEEETGTDQQEQYDPLQNLEQYLKVRDQL